MTLREEIARKIFSFYANWDDDYNENKDVWEIKADKIISLIEKKLNDRIDTLKNTGQVLEKYEASVYNTIVRIYELEKVKEELLK